MKIKKLEIFLTVLVIAVSLLITVVDVSEQQKEIASKLVRIHVIANSDSAEDQQVKLCVRDAVSGYLSAALYECSSKDEACEVISKNIDEIEITAEETLRKYGYDYAVGVALTQEQYPAREYDSFSLPAGEYTSLQIKLGEAEGENWWCVVFPPLCTSAAVPQELAEMSFSEEEIRFITSEETGVIFKFKILEILKRVKNYI